MHSFDCLIIRHRKENIRKCSLRGLEQRKNFAWASYPNLLQNDVFTDLEGCFVLDVEGEILTEKDMGPLILLDATWRYASKMLAGLPELKFLPRRRIPNDWRTAYPRRQTACPDPERGLASIEALFAAFYITGRSTEGLLDSYYWRNEFLEKNAQNLFSS